MNIARNATIAYLQLLVSDINFSTKCFFSNLLFSFFEISKDSPVSEIRRRLHVDRTSGTFGDFGVWIPRIWPDLAWYRRCRKICNTRTCILDSIYVWIFFSLDFIIVFFFILNSFCIYKDDSASLRQKDQFIYLDDLKELCEKTRHIFKVRV